MSREKVTRETFHTRQVTCVGFSRSDGLWDVEGRIVDTKSYPIHIFDERAIAAGEPIHQMRVRITVDDAFVIREAEATTDHAPYAVCAEIGQAYQKLVGLRITPGFTAKVKELFRAAEGCTHITELLGPMATTAFQTITAGRMRRAEVSGLPVRRSREQDNRFLDSCHALRRDGEVAKRHFGPRPGDGGTPSSDAA